MLRAASRKTTRRINTSSSGDEDGEPHVRHELVALVKCSSGTSKTTTRCQPRSLCHQAGTRRARSPRRPGGAQGATQGSARRRRRRRSAGAPARHRSGAGCRRDHFQQQRENTKPDHQITIDGVLIIQPGHNNTSPGAATKQIKIHHVYKSVMSELP